MEEPNRRFKVLSLNCWGLKLVAAHRRERLLAIAEWIAHSASPSRTSYHSDASEDLEQQHRDGYDCIALQEIWVRADFDAVATRAKESGLVHSRFFYSGAIGSGLALLSAHPISSAFMMPYPLNGYPLHFIAGDFFAGKGVCGITIDVDRVGKVDVLNTHMFAPGGEGDGVDGAHRVAQAWELARLATEKSERGRHVIVMGDLNSQPHSIILRFLTGHGALADAFAQTSPPPPSITSPAHRALSPLEVLHQHGITCDSPLNTYSAPKLAKRGRHDETVIRGGKRLDYVLFRSPPSAPVQLVATSTAVVLTETLPAPLMCSYSDHFGLEAVLEFAPASAASPAAPAPLAADDLARALANLSSAYHLSRKYSMDQLKLFALAVVLVPVLAVAASFQPLRYLAWLFVLLAVATGVGGATMLYTGFVGGQWEAGALRNVMAEMETELSRMRRRGEGSQRWD